MRIATCRFFFRIAATLLTVGAACAETRIVPDHHETIQDAINHAQHGDTVLVRAGVYSGRVILNKSGVSLVGEPGATIRDDTPGPLPPVLAIGPTLAGPIYLPRPAALVEGSEVRGLRIESAAANVMGIFGVKNLRVSGVTIVQTQFTGIGIHSWNEGVEIEHSTFIGAGRGGGIRSAPYGLQFQAGQEPGYNLDISLHHNDFRGLSVAIGLTNVRGAHVAHNRSVGNPVAIALNGVMDVDVLHNQCIDATLRGIGIANATGDTIARNLLLRSAVGLEFLPTDAFLADKGYLASDQNLFLHNVFHDNDVDISVLESTPVGPGHNEFSRNVTDEEPAPNSGD